MLYTVAWVQQAIQGKVSGDDAEIARQVAEATRGVPANARRIAETMDEWVTRHGSPDEYGPDYWRDYKRWAVPVIRDEHSAK